MKRILKWRLCSIEGSAQTAVLGRAWINNKGPTPPDQLATWSQVNCCVQGCVCVCPTLFCSCQYSLYLFICSHNKWRAPFYLRLLWWTIIISIQNFGLLDLLRYVKNSGILHNNLRKQFSWWLWRINKLHNFGLLLFKNQSKQLNGVSVSIG